MPDLVQVGNEVDAGMLWPLGRVGGGYDTPFQWSQLAGPLKAAIRGLKSPLGPGRSVRMMLAVPVSPSGQAQYLCAASAFTTP